MSSILKKSSIEQILTFSPPERMRKMSEESEFDDEEDEGHDVNGQKFGGFTSTVCVNFSQDDLRLATIPGQEGVSAILTNTFTNFDKYIKPFYRYIKQFLQIHLEIFTNTLNNFDKHMLAIWTNAFSNFHKYIK